MVVTDIMPSAEWIEYFKEMEITCLYGNGKGEEPF